MIAYIDAHREYFGVEPICRVLQFAPSTYWSARRRPASARSQRDADLKAEIARVHAENVGVYGAPKVWAQLNREGHRVARCTVEWLMRDLGLRGVVRGKPKRTTVADDTAQHAQLKIDTGLDVFFADPHSPWQRGMNENTDGLLRQYFPKGTDLSRWNSEHIDAVAATINSRPRKVLGWRTPAEALDEHLRSLQQADVASTG